MPESTQSMNLLKDTERLKKLLLLLDEQIHLPMSPSLERLPVEQ